MRLLFPEPLGPISTVKDLGSKSFSSRIVLNPRSEKRESRGRIRLTYRTSDEFGRYRIRPGQKVTSSPRYLHLQLAVSTLKVRREIDRHFRLGAVDFGARHAW